MKQIWWILMVLLFPLIVEGQSKISTAQSEKQSVRIGVIDFYGYSGINLDKIRAALPVHEGETFPSMLELLAIRPQIEESVQQTTGYTATDVAMICCDEQSNWLLFIGLPGNSSRSFKYNAAPTDVSRLPPKLIELYRQTMNALQTAVQLGRIEEDRSRGYTLSIYPALRAKQLAARVYAVGHERLLRQVLSKSKNERQRIVAAHFLGYARQSKKQIAALVSASRDLDDTVRNNATRALIMLATSSPKAAAQIPAARFIEMLNSGSWTDRNKAGGLLVELTKWRAPELLNQLRAEALESLLEMARWRAPHAYQARMLLGRIAGIEESQLERRARANDQVNSIINAVVERKR